MAASSQRKMAPWCPGAKRFVSCTNDASNGQILSLNGKIIPRPDDDAL